MFDDDDDEMRDLIERMGSGPVLQKDIPEIIRAMRHVIVNQHVATRFVNEIAKEGGNLGRKALDQIETERGRIDDIVGKNGQKHIDGGGAIGRMQKSMDHIEKLLQRATYGAIGAIMVDIVVHIFVPAPK